MERLRTGQLSDLTGIGRETLRFYEKRGLLLPPERTESGYRMYTQETVKRILFITRAKEAGFSLAEIAATLSLADENIKQDPKMFRGCIEGKIRKVEERIAQLQTMIGELKSIAKAMDEDNCCPVIKKIVG